MDIATRDTTEQARRRANTLDRLRCDPLGPPLLRDGRRCRCVDCGHPADGHLIRFRRRSERLIRATPLCRPCAEARDLEP